MERVCHCILNSVMLRCLLCITRIFERTWTAQGNKYSAIGAMLKALSLLHVYCVIINYVMFFFVYFICSFIIVTLVDKFYWKSHYSERKCSNAVEVVIYINLSVLFMHWRYFVNKLHSLSFQLKGRYLFYQFYFSSKARLQSIQSSRSILFQNSFENNSEYWNVVFSLQKLSQLSHQWSIITYSVCLK